MGKWMFKATVWIVAAVLLTASGAQTRDSFAGAFDRLAKVDVFALGLVSFGAQISQGEKDFELIRARPTALADFERLFAVGNPQAKAYALVGIRRINPERYTRLAQPLRSSNQKVMRMNGCIGYRETFAELVLHIESQPMKSTRK